MSELSITTTQNVDINFRTASETDRMLAYLLDFVVWIAYYFVLDKVFDATGFSDYMSSLDLWSMIAIQTFFSLPIFLYKLLFETFMDGQTPGKRIIKIRVIKIDGYQAGFGEYLMRWLFGLIEAMPPLILIGLIAMVVSKKNQRLGDMAAGTAVITLKNNISIDHTILKEINDTYVPVYPLVIKLSDNDVRIIKETYESSLHSTDFAMIARLQKKIEDVTGIKSVSSNATAFVDTVLNDYNYYTQKM
ncbi:RDD family protein [uncultured Flavobacterium sp.]|uniref:RDD family protein n=1 Tax=uncultured Flavobacterium sp. TaxID=165435 RepID=UPI0025DECFFF|nr:RDD family protein [uncultured Flavobacterium sp.]